MALFNKIFFQSSTSSSSASSSSTSSSSSSTSSSTSSPNSNKQSIHSKNYISQFPFHGGQVRILLFRECDSRGRRLLFDSNALQKVSLKDFEIKLNNTHNIIDDNISIKSDINTGKQPLKGHVNGFVETSDGFLYRHNRPNSMDIPSIGEMVFGALAMSFRGTALKVHWLRSPTRMLCSQVFLSPTNVTNNSITPHHISADHLTPRNSITSDHGSVDGFSMNSFCIGRKNSNVSEHIGDRPYCTNPLDVPDGNFDNGIPRYSATYSTGDSGYSGGTTSNDQWTTITTSSLSYQYSTRSSIGSVMSDAESMRKFSLDSSFFPSTTNSNVSSDGSLQRRISRNLLTSFENQNSLNDFIGFLSDNNFHGAGTAPHTTGGSEGSVVPHYRRASCTNESRSNPEIGRRRDINHFHKASRRAKLGLAVCITMSESFEEEMELFCSEHIALLESMLGRLRLSSEKAYINHKDFLQIMVHAWQATTQWIVDLFTAPRISVPVWLSITTSGSKHSKTVADRFIRDLCLLLSVADTKDTNFFVSTVLTAILTHHLGWVSTISNINSPSKSRAAAIEQRAKLLEVSQKYPYNVLWAQMGDLYGAVGIPPKISRTIIYGTEKLHTERLLNILTYFIRCGEVRRSTKKEVFNKDKINDLIMNQTNDQSSAKSNSFSNSLRNSFSSTISNSASSSSRSLGLTRNATCKTNLNTLTSSKGNLNSDQTENSSVNIHKKNDIPNVLAFRESRLVQQELRIGNYSMDPGITKSSLNNRKDEGLKRDRIKLTITTPENVEVIVEPSESDESNMEDVVEAIEIDSCDGGDQRHKKNASFWSLPVKEGLSWGDLNKLPNLPMNRKLEKRSTSCNILREIEQNEIDEYSELKPIGDKHISLSVLITENSVGKSERLTWGIEPFKEAISLEEEKHFEIQQKIVEKERGITKDKNSVVFVLGENEALVNIKRSNEDLSEVDSTSQSTVAKKPMCPHHHHKKHSGVKFDFAQFPQIYANYMKSKNLSDCDFMEKPQKLENLHLYGDNSSLCSAGTSSLPPIIKEEEVLTEYCEICQNSSGSKSYQTPSNATELEFDTDDDHSVYNNQSFESNSGSRTLVESRNVKVKRGVKPSEVNVIVLPVPGTKEQEMEEDAVARCDMKLKAGFIPSLFLNMSDHYVSDMVLQGTSAPPHQWEANIKEDLTLATHSASLISARAENVAVIADMDKWDVKIVSPQNQMLPYSNVVSGPVGMSQLVASMLETVYTMNNSGISSYDCLSFLESKLQEIYMHSEALAAFLLETDFCSLNAVTSALNLTENDVPLLLSVASIHTPQISKKCGISFR